MDKINPSVHATTLSVLLSLNDSITCGVELSGEYTNVSLDFSDDAVKVLGYPMNWGVYDLNVDAYDGDSPTYEEVIEFEGLDIESMPVYVSRATEREILSQLKVALKKQFEDPMFQDQLSDGQKEEALSKIDKAIGQ